MKKKNKKIVFPSELRQDIVNKDWVIIATNRARRPESFRKEKNRVRMDSGTNCPFCRLKTQPKPILLFSQGKAINNPETLPKDWSLAVIPNKFPAVNQSGELGRRNDGHYQAMNGFGVHEVVITRSHKKDMSQFSLKETEEVIRAFQARYLAIKAHKLINYIAIFHNHGYKAGASLFHPHSQIIAVPIIDPDTKKSLAGARDYWESHHRCVYCDIIKWDKEDGRRVVYENSGFIALSPFAPQRDFEVRVYPKKHLSYFEEISPSQRKLLSEAVRAVLRKLRKALNNPPYNFFLMTSPCDGKDYPYYHWYFDIFPRTSIYAGFELGAGINVSTIEPEKAAAYLRKQ